MDPEVVQARLGLAHYVYREALRGLSQAMVIAKQPPLTAFEKEILFGEVERAVWGIPDTVFRDPPSDPAEWAERADDDTVRDALDRGVKRILAERRGTAMS